MLNKESLTKEMSQKSIYVENKEKGAQYDYIEVTLGDTIKVYDAPFLNTKVPTKTKEMKIPETGFMLKPNELYIGRTAEYTKTYGFVPLLAGTEELAAMGMEIHVTAGFGDNGFEGTWTLEIVCANPTIVYPGMPIGRVYYYPLIGNADIEYRGKYFKQVEPTASRLYKEYNDDVMTLKRSKKDVNK